MKLCSKCHKEKSRTQFNVASKEQDGLFDWCKVCQSDYYRSNKEKPEGHKTRHLSKFISGRLGRA